MSTSQTISADRLRAFTSQIFLAAGFRKADAKRATDVLIWASLRGVDTHGIRNLKKYYIECTSVGWRDGMIVADAELTTDKETPATATLNANGGLGLSVAVQGMEKAIQKARPLGTGIVTVRNSTHFGPAGYYANMAIEHDMIGFASTGYLFPHGQEKAVVPFGGLLAMLSTNPLAMACPTETMPPFVLDMSTSVVPVNRIEMLEELSKSIPLGWALDRQHQSATDPDKVNKMIPLGGSTEFGGHKGYGLAVASWILTGLLSGAWRPNPMPDRVLGVSSETKHGFAQEGIGHIFAAIRLDQFGDPSEIKHGLDSMIKIFNESPPADGFDRVRVPGQPEYETERSRLQTGIPLPDATLTELRSLSKQFEVPLEVD